MKDNLTPGEWEMIFHTSKYEPKKICVGVGVNEKTPGGTFTTMVCESLLPDSDEEYIKQRKNIEADMRLIAEAKNLLHVLKNLQSYSARMRSAGTTPLPPAYDFQINNAIKRATMPKNSK